MAEKSAQQGYPNTRMPPFTEEEKALVRGAADFLGVNHYTGRVISATEHKEVCPVPSKLDDMDVGHYVADEWTQSVSTWIAVSYMLNYVQSVIDVA